LDAGADVAKTPRDRGEDGSGKVESGEFAKLSGEQIINKM
jgi:hypothetical protein